MIDFLKIKTVTLATTAIVDVYNHLRSCGREGVEGVALWAGVAEDANFLVKDTIIPSQKGYKLEDGLLYSVDGDELHRINTWLYQQKKTLMLQIHSHPSHAYHSETDDRYPIISQYGGISVVIPNFGFDAFSLQSWAVYRLFPETGWNELSELQKESLFKIT